MPVVLLIFYLWDRWAYGKEEAEDLRRDAVEKVPLFQREGLSPWHPTHDGKRSAIHSGGHVPEVRPGTSLIRALPEDVGSGVDGVRIVGRNQEGAVPVGRGHCIPQALLRRREISPGVPVSSWGDGSGGIPGPNSLALAGLDVHPVETQVLGFDVQGPVIGRVYQVQEAVSASPLHPVVVQNPLGSVGGGGSRPAPIVLEAPVDPVGMPVIEAHAVELTHGKVGDVEPGSAPIV